MGKPGEKNKSQSGGQKQPEQKQSEQKQFEQKQFEQKQFEQKQFEKQDDSFDIMDYLDEEEIKYNFEAFGESKKEEVPKRNGGNNVQGQKSDEILDEFDLLWAEEDNALESKKETLDPRMGARIGNAFEPKKKVLEPKKGAHLGNNQFKSDKRQYFKGNIFNSLLSGDYLLPAHIKHPDEFPDMAHIPLKYVNGGTIAELEAFINSPNLNDNDRLYLRKRIEYQQLYIRLEREKRKTEAIGPIQKDGKIVLDHIHQDHKQTTNNGCYSCSYLLLLQSRGLHLTQQQIRGYRDSINADPQRAQNDNRGNIIDLAGIVTKCLPNTAIHEKQYTSFGATREQKNQLKEAIFETLLRAIIDFKSPVSLLRGIHYTTIVGYNERTQKFIVKNSLNSERDANKDDEVSIDTLIGEGRFTLTYLQDINPENPTEGMDDIYGVEYLDGHYALNSERVIGPPDQVRDAEGDSVSFSRGFGGRTAETHVVKMPTSFVPTREMQEREISTNTIKKLSESPEKQAFMVDLKARMNELVPQGGILVTKTQGDPNQQGTGYDFTIEYEENGNKQIKEITKAQIAEFIQLKKYEAHIDIMTPWQVKNALTKRVIDDNVEFIANEKSAFKELMLNLPGTRVLLEELGESLELVHGINVGLDDAIPNAASHNDENPIVQDSNEPEKKVEVKTEPEKKVEVKTEPEKKVEVKTEPEKKVEVKTEPEKKVEVKTEPEKKVEVKTEPEKKVEVKTEPEINTLDSDDFETRLSKEKLKLEGMNTHILLEYRKELIREISEREATENDGIRMMAIDEILVEKGVESTIEAPKTIEERLEDMKKDLQLFSKEDLLEVREKFYKDIATREVTEEDGLMMAAINEVLIDKGVENTFNIDNKINPDTKAASKEKNKDDINKEILEMQKSTDKSLKKAMKDKNLEKITINLVKSFYLESLIRDSSNMDGKKLALYKDEKHIKEFVSKNKDKLDKTIVEISKNKKFKSKFKEAIKSEKPETLKKVIADYNELVKSKEKTKEKSKDDAEIGKDRKLKDIDKKELENLKMKTEEFTLIK